VIFTTTVKPVLFACPFVSNCEFHDLGDFVKIAGHDYILAAKQQSISSASKNAKIKDVKITQ